MAGSTPVTIATDDTNFSELLTDTDNLAGMKTDLDTLAGVVSSSKAAVKAASGDFADGAIATEGTKGDSAANNSTSSWSIVALLKGLYALLAGTLTISGTAQPVAGTSGGSTPYHLISASGTNATNLKASPGQVYGFEISNTNASARYVRFYNDASAPTVGTTTIEKTVQVPGNATVIRAYPVGLQFTAGISFSATGAMGDTDTTSIGAGDLSIDIDYK